MTGAGHRDRTGEDLQAALWGTWMPGRQAGRAGKERQTGMGLSGDNGQRTAQDLKDLKRQAWGRTRRKRKRKGRDGKEWKGMGWKGMGCRESKAL